MEDSNYLTLEQFKKRIPGIYKVQKPVEGYKKIICKDLRSGTEYEAIATVVVQVGSIIVRPYDRGFPSDKLRTGEVLITKIQICRLGTQNLVSIPGQFMDCHSMFYTYFKYRSGEFMISKHGLSENLQEVCAPGIHFFLNREDAENY